MWGMQQADEATMCRGAETPVNSPGEASEMWVLNPPAPFRPSDDWKVRVLVAQLWPHGLEPARLLCPWNSPGRSTGVGSHFLLQGIFLTQGSNPRLLHCKQLLLPCMPPTPRTILSQNCPALQFLTQSEAERKQISSVVSSCSVLGWFVTQRWITNTLSDNQLDACRNEVRCSGLHG